MTPSERPEFRVQLSWGSLAPRAPRTTGGETTYLVNAACAFAVPAVLFALLTLEWPREEPPSAPPFEARTGPPPLAFAQPVLSRLPPSDALAEPPDDGLEPFEPGPLRDGPGPIDVATSSPLGAPAATSQALPEVPPVPNSIPLSRPEGSRTR